MLSSLWPARIAVRIASPSRSQDWRIPRPVGDLLKIDLPFTVHGANADGLCVFLEEFLVNASQAGAERFSSDATRAFQFGRVRGVGARIWLAPFDLGVIQHIWIAIHPTDDPNVFEVQVTLRREAGSPRAWVRLNRVFLETVREQFLLWRGDVGCVDGVVSGAGREAFRGGGSGVAADGGVSWGWCVVDFIFAAFVGRCSLISLGG